MDAEAPARPLGEDAGDRIRDGSDAELEDRRGLDPIADELRDREVLRRRFLRRERHEICLVLHQHVDLGSVHAIAPELRDAVDPGHARVHLGDGQPLGVTRRFHERSIVRARL